MHKVLAIGDLHCGHYAGLTPPNWICNKAWEDRQLKAWRFFQESLQSIGDVNTLILNGDLIDGNGARSGGIEQSEIDFDRQCEMAIDIIESISAKKIYITYGTPYHVSNHGSQEESKIAKAVNAEIGGHLFPNIHGITFDIKHKVGSSGIPHGRYTPLAKEVMWNSLQSAEGIQPKADIILRSHVHYHAAISDANTLAMTLPALQGPSTKYGTEQCSGIVDFGLVSFIIEDDLSYTWDLYSTRTIYQ